MTPHKKNWKLRKAEALEKLKVKDRFFELLHDFDLITLEMYMDNYQDIESQKEMIASTIYEAANDN